MPARIPDHEVVLGIDPGNVESAYCQLTGAGNILGFEKMPNAKLLPLLSQLNYDYVAIEQICSYGMPAGASLFDTCTYVGRLLERATKPVTLLPRLQVKLHLCRSPRANDATVRQALIDLFGPPGTKKNPGGTYGISADVWSALAIAETFRSGDFEPYILSSDK